jgi:hypothetical protein
MMAEVTDERLSMDAVRPMNSNSPPTNMNHCELVMSLFQQQANNNLKEAGQHTACPALPGTINLKTSIQATEFTESTENETDIFMFCWLTQKVNHNFVIPGCFSSVISVFSVAN